jgi:hypothetical protein
MSGDFGHVFAFLRMIFAENRFPLFGIVRASNQREYATRRTPRAHGQEGRLPFIKDALARRAAFWKGRGVSGAAFMSPASVQSFLVLLIGFSVAGSLATGYQLVTERPLSFRLLNQGARLVTFLAIPVLTFAAPFVIMRNVVRGRRIERRRIDLVMLATVLAGFWSMLSGTVVVMAFTAFSQLFA